MMSDADMSSPPDRQENSASPVNGNIPTQADLDALRKSVEDAASVSGALWLSYLFTLFYFSIAAGAVTHQDLLLETPVRLPFLNVDLPLLPFFFLAPILFVLVHIYTLAHFSLLGAKAANFHNALYAAFPPRKAAPCLSEEEEKRNAYERESRRKLLPNNIFVQFLAGPVEIREARFGRLLQMIAWTTLVAAPVLLLLQLQIQFLPFHSQPITWVARLALAVDLLFIWWLWLKILAGRSDIRGSKRWKRRRNPPLAALISTAILVFSWTVATFPGEWLNDHQLLSWKIVPTEWSQPAMTLWPVLSREIGRTRAEAGAPGSVRSSDSPALGADRDGTDEASAACSEPAKDSGSRPAVASGFACLEDVVCGNVHPEGDDKTQKTPFNLDVWVASTCPLSLHDALFEGDIDLILRRRVSVFSTTLVLPGFNLFEARKSNDSDKLERKSNPFDLRGRHLEGAALRGAKLGNADLTGAFLEEADLRDSKFDGAQFDHAMLRGVNFSNSELRGATFFDADLRHAGFAFARLQGTSFSSAHLDGAEIIESDVQGAVFDNASLTFATFLRSRLQAASFRQANLEGSELIGANFDGALFLDSDLTATNLSGAHFRAATIRNTKLYGAKLSSAVLNATYLSNVNLWRAFGEKMTLDSIDALEIDKRPAHVLNEDDSQPWSCESYDKLKIALLSTLDPGPGNRRKRALDRIAILACTQSGSDSISLPRDTGDLEQLIKDAQVENKLTFDTSFIKIVLDMLCGDDPDAYVILEGLLNKARISILQERLSTAGQAPDFIDHILSDTCPVSKSLTDDDKRTLRRIKQQALSKASAK